jgi:hypothetical protein
MSKDKAKPDKHAGGRPRKGEKISGVYDLADKNGKLGAAALKYRKDNPDNTAEIDTERLKTLIDKYIYNNSIREIDESSGEEIITGYRPVSRAGLRYYLDISPSTYLLWLKGYVTESDVQDDSVRSNYNLSNALNAGDSFIRMVLSETWNKYGETTRVKLMETMGEIAPAKVEAEVNINLLYGKHRKNAR